MALGGKQMLFGIALAIAIQPVMDSTGNGGKETEGAEEEEEEAAKQDKAIRREERGRGQRGRCVLEEKRQTRYRVHERRAEIAGPGAGLGAVAARRRDTERKCGCRPNMGRGCH